MIPKRILKTSQTDGYFRWLCDKVDCRSYDRYEEVLEHLYRTDFYSLVPFDDNRSYDGLYLRVEYEEENGHIPRRNIEDRPCSVLEMLIALAGRMSFILFNPSKNDDEELASYFWLLIHNLKLLPGSKRKNKETINAFLERRYERSGEGGLFPLKYPKRDQRKVELWYQMHSYIRENY